MAAWTTVDFAREGDRSFLIARLRDPACSLVMEEREYIADLLEGKIKNPRHRRASRLTAAFSDQVALSVLTHQSTGMNRKQAIAAVSEIYGRPERTVKADIAGRQKRNKDRPERAARDAAMISIGKQRRKDGTFKWFLNGSKKARS